MTKDEAMAHMRGNTPLDKVRACLSGIIGAAEQAGMQRNRPSPVEMRVAEFEAVQRLLRVAIEHGLVREPQE